MSSDPFNMDGIHTADFQNSIQDLSSVITSSCVTPYDALLIRHDKTPASHDDVRKAYNEHRIKRNSEWRTKLMCCKFSGFTIDPILSKMQDTKRPDYVDHRNSLVFWARPPPHVLDLAGKMQQSLEEIMPSMWFTPANKMHLTVLEVVHSASRDRVMQLANQLAPIIPELIALPKTTHGCILCKPQISFDLSGVALSFVPWPWEEATLLPGPPDQGVPRVSGPRNLLGFKKQLTIHHLRRELFQSITRHGVTVASRYRDPTAHITLARFVDKPSHSPSSDPRHSTLNDSEWYKENVERFVDTIGRLNKDLALNEEIWEIKEELVCRVGSLWYGDGETFGGGEGREGGAEMTDKEREFQEGPGKELDRIELNKMVDEGLESEPGKKVEKVTKAELVEEPDKGGCPQN